jgi:hypothetical protein
MIALEPKVCQRRTAVYIGARTDSRVKRASCEPFDQG